MACIHRLFLPGAALLCGILAVNAAPSIDWTEISGSNLTIPFSAPPLGALDGHFYTRTGGQVYRSIDGQSWDQVGTGSLGLRGLKLENGHILLYDQYKVTVGDGSAWSVVQINPDGEFPGASASAEGNGRIVLGGFRGIYQSDPAWWVSTDNAQSFTYYAGESRVGDVNVLETIKGLAFGNGIFVAVGYPGEVWTSATGETWTQNSLPLAQVGGNQLPQTLYDVKFVDGVFWACGGYMCIYTSTDGTSWQLAYQGAGGYALEKWAMDGNEWYAGGSTGGMAWSTNGGRSWSSAASSNKNYLDLTGGSGVFYGARYFAPAGQALNTFNALSFDWYTGGNPKVAYTEGKWLAFLNQKIYLGTKPSSFLDSATTADGVYFEHPWLGWYAVPSRGWLYHYTLGWIYSEATNGDDVWIFTDQLGWIHTSETEWPYFYQASSGHWGYDLGGGESFWNESLGMVQSRAEFGQKPWVVSVAWLIGKTLTITDTMGTHTVEIVSNNSVNATFNVAGKQLVFTTADPTVWYDSGSGVFPPGRRFNFDITDATAPGVGDRVNPLVFTFEDETGGTSLLSYTYLSGFPVSRTNISGTFTVTE